MASLTKRAHELEEEFIALRRTIHENPETAFEEFDTTCLIEAELQKYGIETHKNGDTTGVIGILRGKKPGKVVALRADIDALNMTEETGLPFASRRGGKSHSCGHDIHTAALLGCARLLSERREDFCGTVKFFFQPAEEGLGGAHHIIKNGFMKAPNIEAIFGAHVWPDVSAGSIGYKKGPMMAGSDRFKISVQAKGGHAAHPHRTADPIVIAAHIITQLQTIVSRELSPVESSVVTIGKMTAGTASNIIPNEVVLEGTVRTFSSEARSHIEKSIERLSTMTAIAMNATAQVEYSYGTPPVVNNDELTELVIEAGKRLLGEDKVVELLIPSMGSEDFAFYMQQVPGVFFRLGSSDEKPETHMMLHNSQIVISEQAIVTGAIVMCGIVFLYTESDFSKLL